MMTRGALRLAFATLTLIALFVTVLINRAGQTDIKYITKSQVEAVVKKGGGNLVTPSFTTRYSRAEVVVFDSPGCDEHIFARPSAFGDGAFLILESIPDIKVEAYQPQLAYNGDIGAPVGVVRLRLRRTYLELSALLSGTRAPYSQSAVYFLVPKSCDIRNTIAWRDLWK